MITSIVVAASWNDVIGDHGALPWHLPEDLRRFKRLTTGHPVILGRLTHESIVARLGHPLPGRTSVVVSSRARAQSSEGLVWVQSVDLGVSEAREIEAQGAGSEIFVIGGASVYRQTLPVADRIYLTRIHRDIDGDSSMPVGWLTGFHAVAQEDGPLKETYPYSFIEYSRE